MGKQVVFCPECRQEVTYSIKENRDSAKLKGEVYEFTSLAAFCDDCGNEIWDPTLEDKNLKVLYDAYRHRHDIISLEEIKAIPEKYNIGKRPLSLLLGWGEQTFSRYYDGDMPTKQYSEALKQIYASPDYYLSLLERNKDNLKSGNSYTKSKATTTTLLNTPIVEKHSKMIVVVNYLLSQCSDITPLALQKALYYAQGFYYAFYNSFLFEEECEAWVHGPVYRDIFSRYSNYCGNPIDPIKEIEVSSLSSEEKQLLDSIVKHICCYGGKTLESFTHTETPWVITRAELPPDTPSNRIISKQSIGEYFLSVKEKYHMIIPANIKDYTQYMFAQI